MARVNIEDHAFGDAALGKVATGLLKAGLDTFTLAHPAALGALAYLWHESQARRVLDATTEEVERWSGVEGITPILVSAGFLAPVEGGRFRIRGNGDQIAGLEKKAIAGRKGAEARWQTMAPAIECQASASTCQASDSTCLAKNGQLQFQLQERKIVDRGSRPKKEDRGGSVPPAAALASGPTRATTDGTKVWEAYSLAMQASWSTTPPRSRKTASVAKQLVELVGLSQALALAAYYPTRRKAYYVERGHPFELLLSDHMALLRELNAGLKMTPELVRDIVRKEETQNFIAAERAGVVNTNPFELTPAEREEEARRLGVARS